MMVESDQKINDVGSALPVTEITACPLCGATAPGSAGFAYLFRNAGFPGVRCSSCGFVFLSNQPTADGFVQLYDSSYFDSDYHCGHEDRSYFASEGEQVDAAKQLLVMIEKERSPGTLLEVGCAGGFFLQAARQHGWSPVGLEISADAAAFAREKLELEVFTGTLESAQFDPESFDAAYLGDVLEHISSPLQAVQILWRMLRPGGVLMIAGPTTINSIDRRLGMAVYRILGRTRTLREPPYHVNEFTPGTLRQALVRGGFEIRWIRQDKIPPTPGNPRGRPVAEHVAKSALDALNWLVTRVSGQLGDRAIALAVKPLS